MTTSLTELLGAMPARCGEAFAAKLMGAPASASELNALLGDPERLRRTLSELSSDELELVRDLLDLDGYCEWDAAARIYAERLDWLRASLLRLGERGLVFQAGLSAHGALLLLPGLEELLAAESAPPALAWLETETDELGQAVLLLNALRTLGLKCRTEGQPFKKGWQQLDELLGDQMDVHAVYAELLELNCLKEEAGQIKVLDGSASDLAIGGDLRYRAWRWLRACRAYPGFEQRLVRLLENGPRRVSHLRRSLELFLGQHFKGADMSEVLRLLDLGLELGLLQRADDAGWLRLAPDAAAGLLANVFDQPAYGDQVIIKPDLEILVPRELDPLEHVHLGEVADLARPDVMSLYRLSRASVQRAVLAGWTIETLLSFLDRIAKHQLPANVAQSIQAWAVAPGRARILSGTFLFVESARGEIAGLELVQPGVYRLNAEPTKSFRQSLERQGLRLEESVSETQEIDWGQAFSLKRAGRGARHRASKEGVYPYGLVQPLPVGPRGVEIFENARRQHQSLLILYPKRGYGEVLVRRIRPVSLYASAGAHFVEAFCEDEGQAEVFELSKIKALLRA